MAATTPSPVTAEPRRFSIRLPHWGWCLLATVVLVVAGIGLSIWLPYDREQPIVEKIENWGGRAHRRKVGPQWLRQLVGEDGMKRIDPFQRVFAVDLDEAYITDADVAELVGLKDLEWLGTFPIRILQMQA